MESPDVTAPLTHDQLFLAARTHNAWLDRPVDEATLRRLYELTSMGPTSANGSPARFVFVTSTAARERLRPALAPMNVDKTMTAPVTVIVAYDALFHEQMGKLFPARPGMGATIGALPAEAREGMARQNSALEAGYLIIAARSLGLDCGPVGGFDKAMVDAAFFAGQSWRSTLLVNLGYGDAARLHPRNPRLSFEDACRIE